jgi:DNA recombination protein RmuC
MQALVRDARIREEARVIQIKVQKLLEDIERLDARVLKLDTHFRQAQDDMAQIRISTEKTVKHGQKIEALEFDEGEAEARAEMLRLQGRNLRAVE